MRSDPASELDVAATSSLLRLRPLLFSVLLFPSPPSPSSFLCLRLLSSLFSVGWGASSNDARWSNCVAQRSCGDGLSLVPRVRKTDGFCLVWRPGPSWMPNPVGRPAKPGMAAEQIKNGMCAKSLWHRFSPEGQVITPVVCWRVLGAV